MGAEGLGAGVVVWMKSCQEQEVDWQIGPWVERVVETQRIIVLGPAERNNHALVEISNARAPLSPASGPSDGGS